ncbi:MAG: hypothetical protein H7343_11545, partial [Undibacterium sp.]|nr:hypothetical protein [Opitutaceae bacterium]
MTSPPFAHALFAVAAALLTSSPAFAVPVTGEIVDAANGQPVAARLYIRDGAGEWFFATSRAGQGAAIRYEKINRVNPRSEEHHTTLSAHPFLAELPAGDYTFTV